MTMSVENENKVVTGQDLVNSHHCALTDATAIALDHVVCCMLFELACA